jgi:hypothetical protein
MGRVTSNGTMFILRIVKICQLVSIIFMSAIVSGYTIQRTLGNKTRKETRIRLYNQVVTPGLTCGGETWTLTERDQNYVQTAEIKFLRDLARHTGM